MSPAFASVFRREFRFVWIAAQRFGVHPSAIDDAVQDVFLTALRRWSDLRPSASPRAWLYGMTRRIAFRYRRGEGRRERRHRAVAGAAVDREPAGAFASIDEEHDVDRILSELPDERREVFVMAELLGFTAPEIAAHQGVGVNTVYSRLRLARQQLERRLAGGAAALADAIERRDAPPSGADARTWAVLVGAAPALAGGATLASPLGAWLIPAFAALLGTVAVLVWPVWPEDLRAPAEAIADPVARQTPEPVFQPTTVARFEAPTPSQPPPLLRPFATPQAATSPRRVGALASAPDLAAQVELLDRARAQMQTGDHLAALATLDAHAHAATDGTLADVREATRVRVLCRLGRAREAEDLAHRLRHARPDSAVVAALDPKCAAP